MKKFLLMGALTVMVAFSSFAHTGEEVNENVLRSFNKEFTGAENVSWEINNKIAKATFRLNGQVMFAYYQQQGQRVAMTRNIISTQLPLMLLADIKKSYQEYWITDLFEISSEDESSYYLTLQSADQIVVLKSVGVSEWQVYRKQKID